MTTWGDVFSPQNGQKKTLVTGVNVMEKLILYMGGTTSPVTVRFYRDNGYGQETQFAEYAFDPTTYDPITGLVSNTHILPVTPLFANSVSGNSIVMRCYWSGGPAPMFYSGSHD